MEYYGNTLCISARELVGNGIMSEPNYKQLSARGRINVVRRGGRSGYALVSVSSLPDSYREKVNALYPDPSLEVLYAWIEANYEIDQAAVAYFSDWRNSCGHDFATDAHVAEYIANASVLNACIKLYNNAKAIHKTMGMKYDWNKMSQVVEGYRVKVGHTLPSSMLRFRKKVNEYQESGYSCLISGKFGNQSRRKVDHKTERLIISIAALPNKPFNTSVWEMYNAFVCGELDVYDVESGALFNPIEWTDKKGEPLSLSESTIANYLNKPKNRVLIEQSTTSYTTFMHEQMPHVHRHAPEFSFSKISFDDRDLPRKLADTKARPKAYYAYDVTSQCIVGYAYNRHKNVDLVTYCNLFHYIAKAAGVRTEMVSGKTKSRGGNVSDGKHLWVFAYVDGDYGILLDPTWGAGGVNKEDKFIKNDDCWEWFDVDPKWMILTHFPTNPEYQFLEKRVTFDMFKALPAIYPEWIQIGFPTSYIYDYCIKNMNDKLPDLPLILGGCEEKFEMVSVPMTEELKKGETYTFKIRPKVDSDWMIEDGCGEHRDWNISSDGVYTMELTMNCTGGVIIFVENENGRSYTGCLYYIVK